MRFLGGLFWGFFSDSYMYVLWFATDEFRLGCFSSSASKGKGRILRGLKMHLIPTLFAEAAKLAKKEEHSLQLQHVIWEATHHFL